ncbi:LacI family DNA-binding transcriptional regulator [Sphingomonas sp.]|uniref:LacI family DNA-binding transcriptional regulator n=1 Tax=Sphingomonas sp. TaxID=28214 RepID=UPI0025FF6844|nr:substrate-binding domain-containing protein [Sphingomonas sp.]
MGRPQGIIELAQMAGVSASTVSRALAGNPSVAAETRARIQELARQSGFQINQTARALRRQQTQAIGVVLPLGHETGQALSDPFFMSLIGPIADALADRGYDLLLSRVIPTDACWLDTVILSGKVDGVVVVGQSDQIDVIEAASRRGAPLVVWGAGVPGMAQVTVGTDNVEGGRLAGEHLIARGRRRLAFLGNPGVPEFADRLAGMRRAIASAPHPVTEEVIPAHLMAEASYDELLAHFGRGTPPDGLFAASDVIAASALRALAAHGYAVPEQVSVVGYDDVLVALHTTPRLTTIRQDVARGGRLLVDLLFRRLAGQPAAAVQMVPELIVRGSS